MDRQRADRRGRLLVSVAADGQSARRRRPRRLRPHHRRPVHRGRQDGGGDVLAAVSRLARTLQRHPARAHRQGRAGRFRGRAGPRTTRDRWPIPGREHRPAARRNPVGAQRQILGYAREARPVVVPAGGSDCRACGFDAQRRHTGRPGARRRGGLRATVGHSRCAHGADRHATGHAADPAGAAAQAGRFPSAQGDSGSARCRPARRGGRRQRQHRDARAGAGALTVATPGMCRPHRRR